MDRAPVFGTGNVGSIPTEGTKSDGVKIERLASNQEAASSNLAEVTKKIPLK
jgi:hypothetical protein